MKFRGPNRSPATQWGVTSDLFQGAISTQPTRRNRLKDRIARFISMYSTISAVGEPFLLALRPLDDEIEVVLLAGIDRGLQGRGIGFRENVRDE